MAAENHQIVSASLTKNRFRRIGIDTSADFIRNFQRA
jgi:hypothetical protein